VSNPPFLFNELLMEDSYMRGSATEADPAQFPPEPHCFCERRRYLTARPTPSRFFCNHLDIITSYCHCLEQTAG
jgi:hypothetical protein